MSNSSYTAIEDVLHRAAKCQEEGNWPEYVALRVKGIKLLDERYGRDYELTHKFQMELALQYREQGRYHDAENVARDVTERRRKLLGDHADTAAAINSVAISIKAQGRADEGLRLDEEALKMLRRVEGEDAAATVSAMHNLANSYANVGRVNEAARLHETVLARRTELAGKNDRGTIITMDMLAKDYVKLGDLHKAVALQEESVALAKSSLGEADNTTLTCIIGLDSTYKEMDEPFKAQKLLEDSMTAYKESHQEDSPLSMSLLNSLAITYFHENRLNEAEVLMTRFFKWSEKTLGHGHPGTEAAKQNLAAIMEAQGKLVKSSIFP